MIQDDVLAESKDKMAKATAHLQGEFGSIRTGRASPIFGGTRTGTGPGPRESPARSPAFICGGIPSPGRVWLSPATG